MTSILSKIRIFVHSGKNIILALLGASFFVGVWHALPIKDVIADELYFVGGALRAFENYTILPLAGDVPYGTLTYLLNYLLIGFILLIWLVFLKFDVAALKIAVLNSPDWMYLAPRLISAVLALFFVFLVYKLLKKEISDVRVRLFLVIVLFSNIITALILHTGKMWVLSTLLVLASFYFLYKVIGAGAQQQDSEIKKNIFWSVLFSFLAFSNFPLNFFALINIPVIIYFFRGRRDLLISIAKYALIGLAAYALITLMNFGGIKNQILSIFTVYRPLNDAATQNLSVVKSFLYNVVRFSFLFPLLILTFLMAIKDGVRNKKLFWLAIFYFVVYFSVISILATWSNDFIHCLRYLFPLGFFAILILASVNIKFSKIFWAIGVISLIYFFATLYYISAPTTYNQAYDFVLSDLNQSGVVIYNNVPELQLPKNKASYLLEREKSCSTRCRNVINNNLNAHIKPLMIDQFSESNLNINAGEIYQIEWAAQSRPDLQLIKSFGNDIADGRYYEFDYNMGNYFDWNYFRIKNLGKNIYIYKKI